MDRDIQELKDLCFAPGQCTKSACQSGSDRRTGTALEVRMSALEERTDCLEERVSTLEERMTAWKNE